jgi:hypothetical protein
MCRKVRSCFPRAFRIRSALNSQLSIASCAPATSALAAPMLPPTGRTSGPASSPPNRAGSLEMQTHQKCPPRPISLLAYALTRHRRAPALESTLTNSLDLKSPRIRASWPFRSPEVLWRSATAVTRLEYALTKNAPASHLESALAKTQDLNGDYALDTDVCL